MLSSICRTKTTQTFHDSYLSFQSSLIVVTSQYQEIAVVRFVGHLKCDNVNINICIMYNAIICLIRTSDNIQLGTIGWLIVDVRDNIFDIIIGLYSLLLTLDNLM